MNPPNQPDDSIDEEPALEPTDSDGQPSPARAARRIRPTGSLSNIDAMTARHKLSAVVAQHQAALRIVERVHGDLFRNPAINMANIYPAITQVAEAAYRLPDVTDAGMKLMASQVSQAFGALDPLLPNYQRLLKNLASKINFPDFAELFRRYQPANWHDATGDDVQTMDLFDLARDGWPTTWVPGPKVLRVLALAAPDDRSQVLLDHEPQILDDCGAVLAEVTDSPEEIQADLLRQAVTSARHDCHAPAQALAGAVMDTTIRKTVSSWQGYNHWLRMQPDDDEFTVGQMRYLATMAPVRPALKSFRPEKGDGVPPAFNRHATVHATGDIQYTRTNAIVGLLLAVSLVREFHQQHLDASTD